MVSHKVSTRLRVICGTMTTAMVIGSPATGTATRAANMEAQPE